MSQKHPLLSRLFRLVLYRVGVQFVCQVVGLLVNLLSRSLLSGAKNKSFSPPLLRTLNRGHRSIFSADL